MADTPRKRVARTHSRLVSDCPGDSIRRKSEIRQLCRPVRNLFFERGREMEIDVRPRQARCEVGRLRIATALMTVLLLAAAVAPCQAGNSTYDSTAAVTYATSNYNALYGTGTGQNPFKYYGDENCTNFASQCLLAGLSGKTTPKDVLAQARSRYFLADKYAAGTQKWYYYSDSDRGPAWNGVKELYTYAKSNKPTWTGLHFTYVTNDTATTAMDVKSVRKGDIVFADWDADGQMNHAMIVTAINTNYSGYNQIRLTYQGVPNIPDPKGRTNMGLGDINKQYNYKALFYVYRPVDYLSDK
jgi:hypothetical protein